MPSHNRFSSLFFRSINAFSIFFKSIGFALKYFKNNRFIDLFYFRKAIEIAHTSPFRIIIPPFKKQEIVEIQLPHFGNVKLNFHLNDYFQMAICEEFIKYKIYNLGLIGFLPDHSIDCGAYQGYFSFLIAEKYPECKKICIEPHPENYKSLLSGIINNNIQKVTTFNKALSTIKGKISLELWGSNMAKLYSIKSSTNEVSVETIDLYEFLNVIKANESLVIKVDIEGGELDFFPACIDKLPAKCAVYLETHDAWRSLKGIEQKFVESGFSFSILRDRGLYIDSYAVRNG
ncbi:MAG: FkbM family methyltransferase [Ferruginibacter sp.]